MPAAPARTGTQAIERALRILRIFEEDAGPRSLTELAERAGLTLSTTHRLVRALCDAGILIQESLTEHYRLGPRLVSLGQQAAAGLGLSAARRPLESLADDLGESVNLGVRDGDEVAVLLCIPSAQRLRFDQEAGTRVPVYASAMGKVLLAFDARPDEVIGALPRLARLTGHTITSRDQLRAALEQVRRDGFAVNDEERDQGVRTVAAPVLGPDGTARAAVAAQGPTVRMTDDRLAAIGRRVQLAATMVAPLVGLESPPG